ncbi:MAG: translation initiation factor eIF-2B [Candidatus Hodarchaeota archaeon]
MQIQNIQGLLRELKEDNTSGANEFIDKALEIIKLQLSLTLDPYEDIKEEFNDLSKHIINARPSMAPLINTIGCVIHDLAEFNKNIIEERLDKFNFSRQKRIESLELNFHTFLKERRFPLKIMLISYSSTIISLLLNNKEFNIEIFVLESRPLLEGRKTAEILSQWFKTHLIIDAAIGKFINQVDLVLIGVDSILKDGSIINKIGTYPLALLGKENRKSVYAVCDSFKYNLRSHFGEPILIEEKPSKEIYNKEVKQNSLKVHNYYFDITPPQYISKIISNLGILTIEDFLKRVQESLPIEWFKYFIHNKKI